MTGFFAISIYGVLGAIPLMSPVRRARQITVVSTLLIFLLVHTEVEYSAAALLIAFAVNALLAIRLGEVAAVPLFVAAALVWTALRQWFAAPSVDELGVQMVTVAVMLLLAGNVRRLGKDVIWSLQVTVAVTVVLQLTFAVGERFFGLNAPWPRRDGVTFNIVGSNNLWEGLGGRAMGSLGWAITLGQVAALCAILSVWFFARSKRWSWMVAAFSAVFVVLLSGTRTGLLMIAAAGAVALVSRLKNLWITVLLTLATLTVVAAGPLFFGDVFGFGADSEGTRSVEHRRLVSGSIPDLLTQPSGAVLFGHGYDEVPSLLTEGIIQGAPGVPVTDNEIIRTLAGLGIVGAALWGAAFVVAFIRGHVVVRALAVALLIGAASYDSLTWRSLLALSVVILSMNVSGASTRDAEDARGAEVGQYGRSGEDGRPGGEENQAFRPPRMTPSASSVREMNTRAWTTRRTIR
ncbi:O-antigen ligase family protein [Microbacterium sp. NPDC058345]|uniref:O-antigen ligase family protein n=1 Tax=Microbacterium sp. NPDC058345 TaxID=3346455 RepID=UPI00365CA423